MKKLENKFFEIKGIDFNTENNELIVKGHAAMFGNEDALQLTWCPEIGDLVKASDVLEKGCFKKTLGERKERVAFCVNHNMHEPIGKILELKEDNEGLYFEARISDAEPEIKTKIREEIYSEMSFGFQVISAVFEKKKDGTYIRRVKEVKLYELSVVTLGRNDKAKITEFKGVETANTIIDNLYKLEKDEEKKYQLLQLKSLFEDEPIDSLDVKEAELTIEDLRKVIQKSLKN